MKILSILPSPLVPAGTVAQSFQEGWKIGLWNIEFLGKKTLEKNFLSHQIEEENFSFQMK